MRCLLMPVTAAAQRWSSGVSLAWASRRCWTMRQAPRVAWGAAVRRGRVEGSWPSLRCTRCSGQGWAAWMHCPGQSPPRCGGVRPGWGSSRGSFPGRVGRVVGTVGIGDRRPGPCLVDDVHCLDHASADALLFAARRLDAEGVAMLFAARDEVFGCVACRKLRLGGLDGDAARVPLSGRAAGLPQRSGASAR